MSAPGVIVEEGGVATVSVRPSPTIPVFIGAYLVDGARLPITHGCTKINHMADLRKFLSCSVSFSVTVSADKVPSLSSPVVQSSALAVANYFENGGGPCYLLPVALSSDSGQVEAIKLHPDISLVAAVMDNATVDIIEKIIPSLGQNPEYFYIHTPKTLASPPGIPATGKPHVASYHPFLHIKCSHWRDDSGITVSGYEGATTVAQLQTMAPDLYKQVDTLIRTEYAKYPTIVMPSGAAIAAAYCKTDRERGV
ncbi:hypothetical protein, partial [Herbaspirillum sp. YR522]|uniref:hypothetical protein n=1 Tax=Herbaspirillum sp. YR522 TaxID=1144342 RepID=UPI00026F53F3